MSNWTPERHAEVKARCEAADPSPWVGDNDVVFFSSRNNEAMPYGISVAGAFVPVAGGLPWPDPAQPTVDFIAHSITDLPDALAEIERLQALLLPLVEIAPLEDLDHNAWDFMCVYCREFSNFDTPTPTSHEPNCPWFLAMEAAKTWVLATATKDDET